MARYKRFVAAFDNHGDMIDTEVERVFFDFLKHFKPEVRVHGGDCFDLRALRDGASEEEKADGVRADVEAGLAFLRRFDPQAITLGNHDWRLWRAAMRHRSGVVQDACIRLIEDITEAMPKMQVFPYDKRNGIFRMGHLKVIHGYHAGITAAKRAAEVFGSVLMGHIHAIDHYTIPSLEPRMGRACGALCKLDMDYNRAQANTLRQAHGWAYGLLFPDGTYRVWQAENVNGLWVFPSEFLEIRSRAA